jgi:hypothetical protein
MFLYGGSSNIKNIEAYFEASFNIDTRKVKGIKQIRLVEKKLNLGFFKTSDYLNAVAGLYQKKEDINLLSDLIEQKRKRLKKVAGSTLVIGLFVLSGLFYFLSTSNRIATVEDKIAQANSILENDVYKQKLEELEDLKTSIAVLQEYRDNLGILNRSIISQDFIDVDILNSIADNIPIDVEISNLMISNTNISFDASSSSRPSVAQLEKNLKDIDFISEVYIPGININLDEEVEVFNFSVNCTLDGGYSNAN